jgi:hypothetical protein
MGSVWALWRALRLSDRLTKAQIRSITKAAAAAIAESRHRGLTNYIAKIGLDKPPIFASSGMRAALIGSLREVENKSLPGSDLVKEALKSLGLTPKPPPET